MAAVKKSTKKAVEAEKHIVDELIEEVEVAEETPVEEVEVTIDTSIDNSKMPKENVRIKMRENHNCWIGKSHYVLKKGQCYNVPKEVKMRLSRAGLLLPL